MNSADTILIFAGCSIAALVIAALLKKEPSDWLRLFLFCGILALTAVSTIFLVFDTVSQNLASVSHGPVHWHADFEIYNCAAPVDIVNPKGLVNRVGTPVLHEHGDNRIHVEGVVRDPQDISLKEFFKVIGGEMTLDHLNIPTNDGHLDIINGASCPDGKNKGEWQAFRYFVDEKNVQQEKFSDFPNFVLSPYSQIPPGDCLIIEFGPAKAKTDQMCNFYKIAVKKGELHYGN